MALHQLMVEYAKEYFYISTLQVAKPMKKPRRGGAWCLS
jgi:hypothetical protein